MAAAVLDVQLARMSSPRASERATTSENELRDRRVLLVFDLNGLFVERVEGTVFAEEAGPSDDAATSKDGTDAPVSSRTRHAGSRRAIIAPDFRCGKKNCFVRQFAREFLAWCHENFDVAVWSSAMRVNTEAMVENVWGELRHKLSFVLSQEHCAVDGKMPTSNGRGTKPRFLKELSIVWQNFGDGLRCDAANTLLIDDSHYKVARNPPHTSIHPTPFTVSTRDFDVGLSENGALRRYLEKLLDARISVPAFVRANPFVDADNLDTVTAVEVIGSELAAMRVSEKTSGHVREKPATKTQSVRRTRTRTSKARDGAMAKPAPLTTKVYPKPKSVESTSVSEYV